MAKRAKRAAKAGTGSFLQFMADGAPVAAFGPVEISPDAVVRMRGGRFWLFRGEVWLEAPDVADGALRVDAVELWQGGSAFGLCSFSVARQFGGRLRCYLPAGSLLFYSGAD